MPDITEFDPKQHLDRERRQARVAAKTFAQACRSGDVGQFYEACENFQYLTDGWTLALREVARLKRVHGKIQNEFQLLWFETNLGLKCDDKNALLDALRVLFPKYRGPAVRLFRGASAREGRARKLYGASWSTEIERADSIPEAREMTISEFIILCTSIAAGPRAPAGSTPHRL